MSEWKEYGILRLNSKEELRKDDENTNEKFSNVWNETEVDLKPA